MARFMIKASEYKNVCKAINDRQLESLKKEIIEILKKQDEKEFKKAIDYFESQELHYTHLEKSFTGKWIEKAGYGIGTVRIWKGKKYKKIAPGKWARVFEKEGRGTNIAIGKLIAKVQKIDNVEDLMAFVMANKQRFVDENGIDLPVLDKLRAAVDARNNNVSASEKKLIKTKDFKKDAAKYKGKTITYKGASYEIGDYEPGDMNILPRVWLTQYGDKKHSLDGRTFYELLEESKETQKETGFTDKELERLKERGMSVENLRHKGYSDEEIKDFAKPKASKEEIRNQVINGYKNKSQDEIEKDLAYLRKQIKSDDSMTVSLVGSEKMPIKDAIEILKDIKKNKPAEKYDTKAYEKEKDNVLRHTNQDYNSVDEAIIDLNRHKNWINRKPFDETEHEKNVREARLKAVDDIIEGLKRGDNKLLDKFVKEKSAEKKVQKSIVDDFVMDMLIDEDEEDFEVRKIDESLWNDYSAEQPELFNSTELMVREAFNRCSVL